MSPFPAIVAHRGYSTLHRENSPAAWRGAIEAGADFIEVDVRMTQDGVLVCTHDATLERLAGRALAVADATSRDLATVEAAGAPAAPTLELLFATVPENRAILFDVKDERPQTLEHLFATLAGHRRRDLTLGLHGPSSVHAARAAGWDRPILGLVCTDDEDAFFESGGDIVRLWEWDAGPGRIAGHVARGRRVWITCGEGSTGRRVGDHEAEALRRLASEGAGGFLVNDPVSARAALVDRDGRA